MSFRLFFIRASPPLMLSYLFPRLSCDVTAYIPPPEQTYLAETYQTIVDNHWRNIHLETCTCSFHQGLGINYCHRRVCTSLVQAMDRGGGINPGESKRARSINCLRCYPIVFARARRVMLFASRECTTISDFDIDQHVGTAMHTWNISSSQSADPTTPN